MPAPFECYVCFNYRPSYESHRLVLPHFLNAITQTAAPGVAPDEVDRAGCDRLATSNRPLPLLKTLPEVILDEVNMK
jgi:hypothetical protein